MNDLLVPAIEAIDAVYQESQDSADLTLHFHNSHELIYVQEGKIQCSINGKEYLVSENSLVFINNMESHTIKVIDYPYKRYFILIKPDVFKTIINDPMLLSIFNNRSDSFRHVLHLEGDKSHEISGSINRIYCEISHKPIFWERVVHSSLYNLFVLLYRFYPDFFPLRTLNDSLKKIAEIQKYIEEHFLENPYLDQLARHFYMDKYHLSHQFRKVTGFTFKEYLIRQRLSRAKDLLFYTNDSITHVCMNSGFGNVNHFIRIFKKFEGVTPFQYRKSFRQKE